MSNRTDPGSNPTADSEAAADISHPRWGYITRSAGRYGSLTTHLVVYPPQSSDTERLWADLARRIVPTSIGGTALGTILLLGIGAAPEAALVAAAALITVALLIVTAHTSRIRGQMASMWACTSELAPDRAQLRAQDEITKLGDILGEAARSRTSGRISADEYLQTWHTVFERTRALSLPPQTR